MKACAQGYTGYGFCRWEAPTQIASSQYLKQKPFKARQLCTNHHQHLQNQINRTQWDCYYYTYTKKTKASKNKWHPREKKIVKILIPHKQYYRVLSSDFVLFQRRFVLPLRTVGGETLSKRVENHHSVNLKVLSLDSSLSTESAPPHH